MFASLAMLLLTCLKGQLFNKCDLVIAITVTVSRLVKISHLDLNLFNLTRFKPRLAGEYATLFCVLCTNTAFYCLQYCDCDALWCVGCVPRFSMASGNPEPWDKYGPVPVICM